MATSMFFKIKDKDFFMVSVIKYAVIAIILLIFSFYSYESFAQNVEWEKIFSGFGSAEFFVVYATDGFLPPIRTDGSGVYKRGSTLPVKFELRDILGNLVPNVTASLYVAKISDGILGTDEIPLSSSAADTGNQFRYDPSGQQYIFNLATDTLTSGSWQLKALLENGQIITAVVSIR